MESKIAWQSLPDQQQHNLESLQIYLNKELEAAQQQVPGEFTPPKVTYEDLSNSPISLNQLFKNTSTTGELEELSKNKDGSSKKLNNEQLQQIREEARFSVDSVEFKNQKHVWELSQLLQHGSKNVNKIEESWTVAALSQLIVEIPSRFGYYNRDFSFNNGFKHIYEGLSEIPFLLLGTPRKVPKYSRVNIWNKILDERKLYLFRSLTPEDTEALESDSYCYYNFLNKWITNDGKIKIRFDLYSKEFRESVFPHLLQIEADFMQKWEKSEAKLIKEMSEQIQLESNETLSEEDLRNKLIDKLSTKQEDDFYNHIRKSLSITENGKELANIIIDQLRAMRIVSKVYEEDNKERNDYKNKVKKEIQDEHPIKSKINIWLQREITRRSQPHLDSTSINRYEKAVKALENSGFDPQAYIAHCDVTYRKLFEDKKEKEMKSEMVPERSFYWERRIWNPKNWIIKKKENGDGYNVQKYEYYETDTSVPLWRLVSIAKRSWVYGSNVIYYMIIVNLLYGPLGLFSLFSLNEFYPSKGFSEKTGKIYVDKNVKIESFLSRLRGIWKHVSKSRAEFEATPDRGFLGKVVTRWFNRFWNYICIGGIGTLAIVVGQPLLTLLNLVVTVPIAVTSILWVPIVSILIHLYNVIFYDRSSITPLLTLLLKVGIVGLLQVALSAIALPIHPLLALLFYTYGKSQKLVRNAIDSIMFHLIIKSRAKIPAMDSFLARRIKGPGVASSCYYQISSDLVLLGLQAKLDYEILEMYRSTMINKIRSPREKMENLYDKIFSTFGVHVNNNHSFWDKLQKKEQDLEKELNSSLKDKIKLIYKIKSIPNASNIRQTRHSLSRTIFEGEKLVKTYLPKFPIWNENRSRFFAERSLEDEDWSGLTTRFLSEIFSNQFLTPVEDTDENLLLKVEHVSISKLADMIRSVQFHDDLDVVRPKITNKFSIGLGVSHITLRVGTKRLFASESSRKYTDYDDMNIIRCPQILNYNPKKKELEE